MPSSVPWSSQSYHPVLRLPPDAVLLDLSRPDAPRPPGDPDYSIGRYDEDRRGMYTQALFAGARTLHVGVDLGGPAGTEVYAFADGVVLHQGALPEPGDYGHALVTEHHIGGVTVWALHGHLSAASLRLREEGDSFVAGALLGALGAEPENGGWPPHLHFQLSLRRPEGPDLPGVVDPARRAEALALYPDPRLVLGALY